jgi:helix-turn-helix protein
VYGGPGTGIGPALRKARQTRGKSIEEASRDTRIRGEYLQALEREAFGSLRGDVYVRGFLRSYSSYLGLNPDKVVSVYCRSMGRDIADIPEPPPLKPLKQAGLHKVLHRRGNWKLAVAIAVVGLAVAGAVGIISRGTTAPSPAAPGSQAGGIATPAVSLVVTPTRPVKAAVFVDGVEQFSGTLKKDVAQTFTGKSIIRIRLERGGVADLVVNGKDIGKPGTPNAAYAAPFQPGTFRSPAPGG